MKNSLLVIIAAALLCVSAFIFYNAAQNAAQNPDAPVAPPLHVVAPHVKSTLPPHVTRLKKPADCIAVQGDRYKGSAENSFHNAPHEGVTVYNSCKEDITFMDVKASDTSPGFVASILPVRTVVTNRLDQGKKEDDRYMAFVRGGKKCDEKEFAAEHVCRFIAVPPGHAIFISTPLRHWFSLYLKDGRQITGFLMEPGGTSERHLEKMPEKGFKFMNSPR